MIKWQQYMVQPLNIVIFAKNEVQAKNKILHYLNIKHNTIDHNELNIFYYGSIGILGTPVNYNPYKD